MTLSARVATAALFTGIAAAQNPFPPAKPEEVGLDPQRVAAMATAMRDWLDVGDLVGGEVLLIKNGRTVLHEAIGWRDRERHEPFQKGTICRIRSMTKPFVATAILLLMQDGKLDLDNRVAQYIPSWLNGDSATVTIRQLLTNEAGFPHPGYPDNIDEYPDLRAAVDDLGAKGPDERPGTVYGYSDASAGVLGEVVTVVARMPVEDFISQRILEPLRYENTHCNLGPDDRWRQRVSSTYIARSGSFELYWDHEERQQMSFFRASGGMYSTAVDYARFLHLWMNDGADGDMSLLLLDTVREALQPTKLSIQGNQPHAMQWFVYRMPVGDGLPAFGHSGADGTIAVAMPQDDLILCYFTQSRGGQTMMRMFALLTDLLPEATALTGEPLYRQELAPDVAARRGDDLTAARTMVIQNPGEPGPVIWLGRRLAYLGRYRSAIDVFSRALVVHPDEPRLLRHRGHRFVSVREFDLAIADLRRAGELIEGTEDEVEPDGMPNARNIPTSTLQSNVWYHLGLAHYLKGDFAAAADAYARCMKVSNNPDMLCATSHWYYMTLRRLGRDAQARALLEPITADLDVIENHDYHRLLLMYRGERKPEDWAADDLSPAAAYGIANWLREEGETERAKEWLQRTIALGSWAAFGHIAAEAEMARMK